MTVLRLIARPMLASMFIYGGINSLRNARATAPKARATADVLSEVSDSLAPELPVPTDPATLVRINAVTHIAAGTALATGFFPRTAASVLAASLVPTTMAGHQYWNESDPGMRTNQKIHFLKNVSMAGGLLLSTLDPDPHKRSLFGRVRDWRSNRRAATMAKSAT